MYKKEIVIKNEIGLHARPGAELTKLALFHESDVYIEFNNQKINAKEVLDVLSANINKGDSIIVMAEGIDEKETVEDIINYLSSLEE